jgi:hypothetical protein
VSSRAIVACKHGHLHRGREAAHLCEVAHRINAARKLETGKLVAELRAVLAKRKGN